MSQQIYLVLENGEYLEGKSFGAPVNEEILGEVVFTTGMTGYLETLTDPSYYGQIVVQTFPLIGNYGIIPEDFESRNVFLSAYIVREWCQNPSNYRSEGNLDTFFKEKNIPGLYDIDTRYLTKVIREYGVMNGKLTTKAPPYTQAEIESLKQSRVQQAVEAVSRTEPEYYPAENGCYNVVLWDFGAKQNIIRELNRRGCNVTAVPAMSTAGEIIALHPDGIMLSNGPGDPQDNPGVIEELKKICGEKIPTFGICLGHQLLALSQGARTGKLKYGHRGANQPVKEMDTGRIYMTSQNHGYAVLSETLPPDAQMNFMNLNDKTCEGVSYRNMPAFSVQFHPEACAGPKDTEILFDRFLKLMSDYRAG